MGWNKETLEKRRLEIVNPTRKTLSGKEQPSIRVKVLSFGVGSRPRLFEVLQKVDEINRERKRSIGYLPFVDKSYYDPKLKENPELELDYIVAPPRMAYYIQYSTRVYEVYLKYIAPEDIYPYSIDEVFIDATDYLDSYKMTAHELALKMVRDVLASTGITATAGIGTNNSENLTNPALKEKYIGPVTTDYYGRQVPKHAHGTANLGVPTSSSKVILQAVKDLFTKIVNPSLLVRRINVTVNHVISEHPAIVVTYFEPDKKKAGGAYKTIEGQLQNIDDYSQCLVMKDGKVVFIRSVLDIQY